MSDAVEIELPSGHVAVIDAVDSGLMELYRWRALVKPRTIYVQGRIRGSRGRTFLLHRILMDAPPGLEVDHRDGNGLNNRRANLRMATGSQNHGNQRTPRTNTSGYKGVHWDKQRLRWVAYARIEGRRRHLGYFDDPWDAARAYNEAALAYWGEFARLNVEGVVA